MNSVCLTYGIIERLEHLGRQAPVVQDGLNQPNMCPKERVHIHQEFSFSSVYNCVTAAPAHRGFLVTRILSSYVEDNLLEITYISD